MIILPTARAQVKPRASGGGAAWTPASIGSSNSIGWWDGSDSSTITQSSGNISELRDKSGNSNHITPVSSTGVTVVSSGLNSLNVIGLNGDFLTFAYSYSGSDLSAVVIAKYDNTAGIASYGRVMSLRGTGVDYSDGRVFTVYRDNSNNIALNRNAGGPTAVPVTSGQWYMFGVRFLDTTSADWQVGATSYAVNSLALGAFGLQNITIGGHQPSSVDYWNGPVAEVVITKTGDVSTYQKLQGYLAHKWGLTAQLDSGHPYKTTPP